MTSRRTLAARLCADARPGEILITERVASTLEAAVESEPRGCRQLKGLHHPVPVYRVLWLKSAQPF
jgi:adenylate cyclase